MKKTTKIFLSLLWVITLIVTVFASVTVAKERKSAKLPWTWTLSGSYDSAHNVWTSYLPESRFSTWWSIPTWVVYDSVTTLYWQATANTSEQTTCKTYDTNTFTDTNCNDGIVWDDCNWCGAKSYCDALSLWWYSDWRLPNKNELLSIIDTSRYNPGINTTYFNSASSNYWSSTTYAAGTNNAWFVYFYYGSADNTTRTYSNYVRCVR
jgi:hypothetical protein